MVGAAESVASAEVEVGGRMEDDEQEGSSRVSKLVEGEG